MIHAMSRLFLCALGYLLLQGPVWAADSLPTIAVLPLARTDATWNWSNREKVEADINQSVTEALFNLKKFKVVERELLGKVMREGRFQNSGAVSESTAVAIGRQTGAKQVVVGSFSTNSSSSYIDKIGRSYDSGINLNLRIINTESGEVENMLTVEGSGSGETFAESVNSAIRGLRTKLQRDISNLFPTAGYVIKVSGENEAIIDIGKTSGINTGDVFVVYEQGEDIIHPVTGKRIKGERRAVTELKVTAVNDELSTVRIIGDKGAIKLGMKLESKKRGGWSELFDKFR